jgi:hypothetical protein
LPNIVGWKAEAGKCPANDLDAALELGPHHVLDACLPKPGISLPRRRTHDDAERWHIPAILGNHLRKRSVGSMRRNIQGLSVMDTMAPARTHPKTPWGDR